MADEPKAQPRPEPEKPLTDKALKLEKFEKIEHKEKPEKIEFKEKPEKFEHKEKPEKFEHKEKPEKFEHKEKPEIKEIHKIEIREKQIPEGTLKDLVDGGRVGNPGDPIEQRLAALEQAVTSLQHFITSEKRPDLSRGALRSEPDSKPGR
ncbi:MAG TPA: hypothetical protein VMT29_15785 [Steroidobacteraceae bacterium]|nr:hypothetical protein [Steroidobacteraceae bacterium]